MNAIYFLSLFFCFLSSVAPLTSRLVKVSGDHKLATQGTGFQSEHLPTYPLAPAVTHHTLFLCRLVCDALSILCSLALSLQPLHTFLSLQVAVAEDVTVIQTSPLKHTIWRLRRIPHSHFHWRLGGSHLSVFSTCSC